MAGQQPMHRDHHAPDRRRRLAPAPPVVAAREQILAAADAAAAHHGYTSITAAAVSTACGLPASAIRWHFQDDDHLVAAVIERGYLRWLAAWRIPRTGSPDERAATLAARLAEALQHDSTFLRIGLTLMRQPSSAHPQARVVFMGIRAQTFYKLAITIRKLLPVLGEKQAVEVATYALAGADGMFNAADCAGASRSLGEMFALHTQAVAALARTLTPTDRATVRGEATAP